MIHSRVQALHFSHSARNSFNSGNKLTGLRNYRVRRSATHSNTMLTPGSSALRQAGAKHYSVDSVTFPAGTFKLTGQSLHLQKIGHVALCGSNPYEGCEARSVVVRKEQIGFYATVCYEVPDERVSVTANGEAIGIDLNVGQFATSDGDISRMADVKVLEARKKRYARQMARRQRPNHKQGIKPSNRYLKSRRRFNRASKKIRNIRSDWHHQESRTIANAHQYAVVEDLNVQGMTQSAKGDADDPGRHVKQKSGLNREILKTGWFSFTQKLAYKAELIEVDPKHTSQMCHQCGCIDRDSRRTQARFHCVSCGHPDNADVNAALNILGNNPAMSGTPTSKKLGGGQVDTGKADMQYSEMHAPNTRPSNPTETFDPEY